MTATHAPASILVVDDTVENLRLLASLLGEHAYEVRPVTSGRQALTAVEHDPPDLILLDINMPEMNGYEVCRRLKQREALRGIPIIFLTAMTDVDDKVAAFEAGAVDFITKPFEVAEVLARVGTHLRLRRAELELSQSYQRLRALEQVRDELVQMLVHDMRGQLTVLLMCLQVVAEGPAGRSSPAVARDLRDALTAAETLNRMANDVLDVSRLEEARMPITCEPCDLVEIARDVTVRLAAWGADRRIAIDADGPVTASCDADVIRRVLENLVGNAIKHTPAGTDVRVSVARSGPGGDGVRIEVLDRGRGIPPDARARIFEKFGTLAARQEHGYHSVGLGLPFCKAAVEAHGGSIGVEPGADGGSRFWFELPA